jgi:hypothetical protein
MRKGACNNSPWFYQLNKKLKTRYQDRRNIMLKKTIIITAVIVSMTFVFMNCDTETDPNQNAASFQIMYGGSPSNITCDLTYGCDPIGDDHASYVQQTSDGGYIMAGYSSSLNIDGVNNLSNKSNHKYYDFYIIKADKYGEVVWHNMYGGTGDDRAYSIQEVSGGGYIVVGTTDTLNILGGGDILVIRLDSGGGVVWKKQYGGPSFDHTNSISQTTDGGFIVAGSIEETSTTDINYYVVKIDAAGGVEWERTLGGSDTDWATSIRQTLDGGYVVAGWSESKDISGVTNHGGMDYYVIKLDGNGNVEWQKMYGGSLYEQAKSILQTPDGGYIVAGDSASKDIEGCINGGNSEFYIIKLDSGGTVEWQKMYGGSGIDYADSIYQTSDGGYVVAGYSSSTDISGLTNAGEDDYYIIRLDSGGNVLWQRMYGGTKGDQAHSVQQTADGGYVVFGSSGSEDITGTKHHGLGWDYYIIKLDANGNLNL